MELLKEKCKREGYTHYYDLYLKWSYEGKDYLVRVRPVFPTNNKHLLAKAKDMK